MHSAENFDCRGLLFHAIRTSKNSVFCKIKRICNYEYVREFAYENTQFVNAGTENSTNFESANIIENGNGNERFSHKTGSEKSGIPHRKNNEKSKLILTNQLVYALSAALGVVTNTLFVAIFTLIFFNGTSIAQNTVVTVEYVLAWFGVNFAIEVVSFSLLTPPIVLALKAAKLA